MILQVRRKRGARNLECLSGDGTLSTEESSKLSSTSKTTDTLVLASGLASSSSMSTVIASSAVLPCDVFDLFDDALEELSVVTDPSFRLSLRSLRRARTCLRSSSVRSTHSSAS